MPSAYYPSCGRFKQQIRACNQSPVKPALVFASNLLERARRAFRTEIPRHTERGGRDTEIDHGTVSVPSGPLTVTSRELHPAATRLGCDPPLLRGCLFDCPTAANLLAHCMDVRVLKQHLAYLNCIHCSGCLFPSLNPETRTCVPRPMPRIAGRKPFLLRNIQPCRHLYLPLRASSTCREHQIKKCTLVNDSRDSMYPTSLLRVANARFNLFLLPPPLYSPPYLKP